jgi:hypothetical protein
METGSSWSFIVGRQINADHILQFIISSGIPAKDLFTFCFPPMFFTFSVHPVARIVIILMIKCKYKLLTECDKSKKCVFAWAIKN